ncbi:MAG: methyltransferase domain-containing protein [Bacteroidetes bacterium]|nr:MAG: methyltransferase domain-containing protein [Bacteroidota bacterium]
MNTEPIENEQLRIDIGCGPNKKPGFKGMDILPLPGVDYVVDLEKGFSFLKDNSVDEYYTAHFLEHIDNFELVMGEIYRTLKPESICTVFVPHFSNPYYYSDYTHKRFFGLYSFDYFSPSETGFRRKVPCYNSSIKFEIVERRLILKSPDFFVTNLIKKYICNRIFNSGKYFQAVYEEYFTKIISCYELKFVLKVIK